MCWKMALEKRHLPEVDRKVLYNLFLSGFLLIFFFITNLSYFLSNQTFHQRSGYIDMDKISTDAWPAIVADLSSGESGIISLAFGTCFIVLIAFILEIFHVGR